MPQIRTRAEVSGQAVLPVQHADYLATVPRYTYQPSCGHRVAYTDPIPVGGYAFCRQCDGYWRRTKNTPYALPRNRSGSRALSEVQQRDLVDFAIMRNRVAALVIARDGWESSPEEIAVLAGCDRALVFSVQRDLGLRSSDVIPVPGVKAVA